MYGAISVIFRLHLVCISVHTHVSSASWYKMTSVWSKMSDDALNTLLVVKKENVDQRDQDVSTM